MKKKFHRHILYYLLIGAINFFGLLPYRWAAAIGGWLGRVTYHLLGKDRKKMLEHLQLALGNEKSPKEISLIARGVFDHLGRMAAETCLVHKILNNYNDWVGLDGGEYIDEALKKGKGIVGICAHFGTWELMGGGLAMRGYPVTVVARRIYFDKYNDIIVNLRRKVKMEIIYRDDSPRSMLKLLKRNRVLVFIGDQDVSSVDGVFVNFFGRPAYTPVAPVRFAAVSGAALIPGYIIRDGYKHRIIINKPFDLVDTGDKEKDAIANTQQWVSHQEAYIRKYPQLWVWHHKRWKTQPK